MGYAFLADVIVSFHFCYVAFTIGGEILILLGGLLKWGWIRNLPFRIIHLVSVVVVAAEALGGASCPLTVWEYRLRMLAGQRVEGQITARKRASAPAPSAMSKLRRLSIRPPG